LFIFLDLLRLRGVAKFTQTQAIQLLNEDSELSPGHEIKFLIWRGMVIKRVQHDTAVSIPATFLAADADASWHCTFACA
jgi:hypothetical protein